MKGVDISGWQAGFNVGAVDADFVFIKATGGGSFVSAEYTAQTNSAEASGKPHGFYHYASEKGCAADPITEANHFLTTIAGHVGPGTGIALDWEETNLGNTAWAYQWLEHVRQALGRPTSTIFIYMSQATVNAYDWSAVINAGYRLWCAQYPTMAVQGYGPITGPPPVNWGAQGITMWQYTSAGRINGWGGNLDLNVLYTDWDTIHAQADSITPIEGFLMALTDDEQRRLLAAADRINGTIPDRRDPAGNPYTVLLSDDGGTITGMLAQTFSKADGAWQNANMPAAVWNAKVNGASTAAGVLNHIDQKPATATASVAQVDVDALATKLAATLPPAVVAQLAAQLAKL